MRHAYIPGYVQAQAFAPWINIAKHFQNAFKAYFSCLRNLRSRFCRGAPHEFSPPAFWREHSSVRQYTHTNSSHQLNSHQLKPLTPLTTHTHTHHTHHTPLHSTPLHSTTCRLTRPRPRQPAARPPFFLPLTLLHSLMFTIVLQRASKIEVQISSDDLHTLIRYDSLFFPSCLQLLYNKTTHVGLSCHFHILLIDNWSRPVGRNWRYCRACLFHPG